MLSFIFLWACSATEKDSAPVEDSSEPITDDTAEIEPEEPEEPEIPDNPNIDEMIDATDSTQWVYFDLESSSLIPADEVTSESWDIAFQRYSIMLNGGVSGTGLVEIIALEGEYDNFENVMFVEDGTWITDEADSDGDEKPEYAFDSWFDYDLATHVLTPADIVYILRTVENNYFRFRILDYYSAQGDSGYMSIEFDLLEI